MKKLLLTLLLAATLTITGCNKQIVDFKLKFKKVHVFETHQCYEIDSWKDYENSDQIQVKISNHGTCLFHSNQIVLIEDKCPFCD